MWFSETANELLYEEYFTLTNIEKDFLPVFKKFYSNKELRTCQDDYYLALVGAYDLLQATYVNNLLGEIA